MQSWVFNRRNHTCWNIIKDISCEQPHKTHGRRRRQRNKNHLQHIAYQSVLCRKKDCKSRLNRIKINKIDKPTNKWTNEL